MNRTFFWVYFFFLAANGSALSQHGVSTKPVPFESILNTPQSQEVTGLNATSEDPFELFLVSTTPTTEKRQPEDASFIVEREFRSPNETASSHQVPAPSEPTFENRHAVLQRQEIDSTTNTAKETTNSFVKLPVGDLTRLQASDKAFAAKLDSLRHTKPLPPISVCSLEVYSFEDRAMPHTTFPAASPFTERLESDVFPDVEFDLPANVAIREVATGATKPQKSFSTELLVAKLFIPDTTVESLGSSTFSHQIPSQTASPLEAAPRPESAPIEMTALRVTPPSISEAAAKNQDASRVRSYPIVQLPPGSRAAGVNDAMSRQIVSTETSSQPLHVGSAEFKDVTIAELELATTSLVASPTPTDKPSSQDLHPPHTTRAAQDRQGQEKRAAANLLLPVFIPAALLSMLWLVSSHLAEDQRSRREQYKQAQLRAQDRVVLPDDVENDMEDTVESVSQADSATLTSMFSATAPAEIGETNARAQSGNATDDGQTRQEPIIEEIEHEDFTRLYGISQDTAEVLYGDRLTHYWQLARATTSRLRSLLDQAGTKFQSVNCQTWPKQAALAMFGHWDQLHEWYAETQLEGEAWNELSSNTEAEEGDDLELAVLEEANSMILAVDRGLSESAPLKTVEEIFEG